MEKGGLQSRIICGCREGCNSSDHKCAVEAVRGEAGSSGVARDLLFVVASLSSSGLSLLL